MPAASFIPDIADDVQFGGRYLFDTNVWISIQGPYVDARDFRTQSYSGLMKKILQHGGTIIVSPVVIMEFVKVFISIQFNALYQNQGDAPRFKEFRQTPAYKEIAENISDEVFHLLGNSEFHEIGLTGDEYDQAAKTLVGGALEFNDALLVQICMNNGFILVTDDYDFADSKIDILSANRKYKN